MVLIMVLHVRSKYTAVGRTEIATFFYLYGGEEFFAIFLDSSIIPSSSPVYAASPYSNTRVSLLSAYLVLTGAVFAVVRCHPPWPDLRHLLVPPPQRLRRIPIRRGRHAALSLGKAHASPVNRNPPLSLLKLTPSLLSQSFRISSFVVWLITAFLAIATFKSVGSLSPSNAAGLWVVEFIFCGACAAIYTVLQFVLVLRTLDDRWPLGDLLFGLFFFAAGLVIQFGFSVQICDAINHYIDGLFFNSLCSLLAVMMVYKYWDSITKEDLEFSVGSKQAVWEVKDLGYGEADALNDFGTRHGQGQSYPPVKSASGYGY